MKATYTSPSDFYHDFSIAHRKYWDDRKTIENEIQSLNKKKEELFYPRLEEQLYKLVEQIKVKLKADAFEISRHGGLSNRVAVWFTKGKPSKKDDFSNTVGYLCFAEYSKGNVALVSNLKNDEVIDLNTLSIDNLVKIARKNK